MLMQVTEEMAVKNRSDLLIGGTVDQEGGVVLFIGVISPEWWFP
jgi:hypothetical protein